jgi:uncharacterized membrane protein YqjE
VAHSASAARTASVARPVEIAEPSVGSLAQSAMADVSTLIRGEVELAKTEISRSAKKAGIGAGAFGAAGVVLAFSAFFLFIAIAEAITALGLPRWISYLIVWAFLVLVAAVAGFIGLRMIKKVEKPERTIESLKDLPEVLRREEPGARRREVPTVSNGRVELRGSSNYKV